MNLIEFLPLLIILITTLTSIKGFNNNIFFDRLKFNVGAILGKDHQWDRLISSAFLHGDWLHLIFNMYALYSFSNFLVDQFGTWKYLSIYLLSIIGGGLLSLFMHRREYYYSAIGASGGVMGIIYASIALYPSSSIGIFPFPFLIPGWIFGVIYMLFSIYGMKNDAGNIGHDAHMGGAAVGLLMTVCYSPDAFINNGLYIGLMVLPLIILGFIVWKKK